MRICLDVGPEKFSSLMSLIVNVLFVLFFTVFYISFSVIILISFCFASALSESFSSLSSLELIEIFRMLILPFTASNSVFKSAIVLCVSLHYFPMLSWNLYIFAHLLSRSVLSVFVLSFFFYHYLTVSVILKIQF